MYGQSKMAVHCLSDVTGLVKLAGLEWYGGRERHAVGAGLPSLVVAFDNGRCQLMTHELDASKEREGLEVGCTLSVSGCGFLLCG